MKLKADRRTKKRQRKNKSKSRKSQSSLKGLRATLKNYKKLQKDHNIKDVPFSKTVSKGTEASCNYVDYHYQNYSNVTLIPYGSGEFTRKMGMLILKDNLGFGLRSWRYAAVVNDCVIESWFEEPGFSDNHLEDPYKVSSPQNILNAI